MPSKSLIRWRGESAAALDELEAAHVAVGGAGRGRRYATQQINQAYVVLLSSRFQQFCRDLHTEAVAELVLAVPTALQLILQKDWTTGRLLDRGNPNAGNIGSDFGRLGMNLWADVYAQSPRHQRCRALLDQMMEWRNAIGHQDFNKPALHGRTQIQLAEVRLFRRACGVLAAAFDETVLAHLHAVAGPSSGW